MRLRDFAIDSSARSPTDDVWYLSGFGERSLEVLYEQRHLYFRKKFYERQVRFLTLCQKRPVLNILSQSHVWSSDYLRDHGICVLQKIMVAFEVSDTCEVTYEGNVPIVTRILRASTKANFSFVSILFSIIQLGFKIVRSFLRFFINWSRPIPSKFRNVFYTVPFAVSSMHGRFSCRYWGPELEPLLNVPTTSFLFRGARNETLSGDSGFHEETLLPWYLFPIFVLNVIKDFYKRLRAIYQLANDNSFFDSLEIDERCCRRYWINALCSMIVEDSVSHVLYQFLGKSIGKKLVRDGNLYLLSENQCWERSVQIGLKSEGFAGTVVNFYHGGIKPAEARYDLHGFWLTLENLPFKNIFVATADSVPLHRSNIDFFVHNAKLARTVEQARSLSDSSSDAEGILVFCDIDRWISRDMITAMSNYIERFSESAVLVVKWHPAWSQADIDWILRESSGVDLVAFHQSYSVRFKWAVSSCLSSAALDGISLELRSCIFMRPEWLNISPISLKYFEKIILPNYVIENPYFRDTRVVSRHSPNSESVTAWAEVAIMLEGSSNE